jgi:septal ring factor EnvC (AmiA/AmiB activator)
VDRLGDRGMLTTCAPGRQASGESAIGAAPISGRPDAKRRSYWRKRVDKQRDRIADVEEELALLDAKIDALEDRAFQSSRNAAKLWAQADEQRERRRVVEDRLKRERSKLSAIIREARQEGAQPGWFR